MKIRFWCKNFKLEKISNKLKIQEIFGKNVNPRDEMWEIKTQL